MKKILTIFILMLITIVGNVYAADPIDYYVYIDLNDNITVRRDDRNGPIVSDYSSLFFYSNGVLTVKENQYIKYIGYQKDLTITSNDKPVEINNIYSSDTSGHPIKTSLTLSHLNTTNSRYQLETDYPDKIVIENSHIGDHRIYSREYDNVNAGIFITNSEIIAKTEYNEVHPYSGDLVVKNSTIKTKFINNESRSIFVDDSTIQLNGGLYTEEDASIKINNSTITGPFDTAYIEVQLGPDHSEGLIINNSTIEVGRLGYSASREGILKINKSKVKTKQITSSRDMSIIDSYVETNRIQADYYNEALTLIDNSTVLVGDEYINTYYFTINNSYVTSKCRITSYNDVSINNSYFNMTIPDQDLSMNCMRSLSVTNSNFYVETAALPIVVFNTFTKDDTVNSLDKANTKLKMIQNPDAPDFKIFAYDNNTNSKSVKLTSLATVTFKLENGTWEDGTTDDKVITVPIWTALKENDIPKVKKGSKWKPTVEVGTVIKKDTTFLNGVEVAPKVDKNPNTGVYNYILEFIGVAIISTIIYLAFKSRKKFKNM